MERGLLWLPLLVAFFWLTWSGWNEYQKLEAYKVWAASFDNAKFDIYAVLGRKADLLTWGKPTRKGMVELDSFSLNDVQQINLLVGDRQVEPDGELPSKGKPSLEFDLQGRDSVRIPFTDITLANKWRDYLGKSEG
ncbi:MAG: hypothetical protein AAFO95_03650 [Cyanobacteria bacterium J06600_6]